MAQMWRYVKTSYAAFGRLALRPARQLRRTPVDGYNVLILLLCCIIYRPKPKDEAAGEISRDRNIAKLRGIERRDCAL